MAKQVFIDFEKLKGALHGHQRRVAREIGISQASLSYKVNQHQRMDLDLLNHVARTLGRDTTDFLIFEGKIVKDIIERAAA